MPLTSQQLNTVHAMEWLLDPEIRREGRTFSQAVAYIRVAARHPGMRLRCQDHSGVTVHGDRMLLQTVQSLVHQDMLLAQHAVFEMQRASFRFEERMTPVLDWWPNQAIPLPSMLEETAVEELFDNVTSIQTVSPPKAAVGVSRWACL